MRTRGVVSGWMLVLLALASGCEKEVVRVPAGANGFIGADSVAAGDGTGAGTDSGGSDATGDAGPIDGPCTEGAYRCKEGGRERCDAAGSWQPEPCPAATPNCLLGACVPCSEGDARCGESGREVCDAAGAFQPAPCPSSKPTCVQGSCQLCLPGGRFCVAEGPSAAAICDATGQDAESVTPYGEGVACKAGWCQICTAGATRCTDGVRERCADHGGAWQADVCPEQAPECAGEGVCRVCTPGTLRCGLADASHVERCSDAGDAWLPFALCSAGQLCDAGSCKTCKPGTTRCVGSRVLVCGADGAGYDVVQDCAAQQLACVDGACSCTIGSTSCTPPLPGLSYGAAVASCDGTGKAATVLQSCSAGQICESAGCKTCVPGKTQCSDDTLWVCKPDASGLAPTQLCKDAGQLCVGGACVTPCGGGAGALGCTYDAIDPPRAAVSSADPAPAATATPLQIWLTPRVGSVSMSAAKVGGLDVTPPSGSVNAGAALSVSLASWNKPASQSPTQSGQPAAVSLALDNAAAALLVHGSSDQSAAAATALPGPGAAGTYHVLGWPSGEAGAQAWIAILGRGSKGKVAVTVQGAVQASSKDAPGIAVPELAAGGSFDVELGAGAAVLLMAAPGADLTGSTVEADTPVVVLVGHRGARVPLQGACLKAADAGPATAGACLGEGGLCFADADCGAPCCGDPLLASLDPVARWGTVHVVARSQARGDAPDVVRVLAAQSGTLLLAGPNLGKPRVLKAGEPVDLLLPADAVLVADGPVAVAQLLAGGGASGLFAGATGDPAMTLLPPTSRWSETHAFAVPSGVGSAYLAIAAAAGTTATLDGQPVAALAAIGSTGFGAVRVPVAAGAHRLVCNGPCQAVMHGYGKASGWMTSVGAAP